MPSYLSIKPVYGMMGILIYFEIQNSYKMFSGEEGICSQLIKTSGECLLGETTNTPVPLVYTILLYDVK